MEYIFMALGFVGIVWFIFSKEPPPTDSYEECIDSNNKSVESTLEFSPEFFMRAKNNKIPREHLFPIKDLEDTGNFFYGKKVVISGVFDKFPIRKEISKLLWSAGADIDTGIGNKTDYLIIGQWEVGPKKLEQAKLKGIEIIDEDKLLSHFPNYKPKHSY